MPEAPFRFDEKAWHEKAAKDQRDDIGGFRIAASLAFSVECRSKVLHDPDGGSQGIGGTLGKVLKDESPANRCGEEDAASNSTDMGAYTRVLLIRSFGSVALGCLVGGELWWENEYVRKKAIASRHHGFHTYQVDHAVGEQNQEGELGGENG